MKGLQEQIGPHKKSTRFFKWFCRPEYFEELQGDLEERFFVNVNQHGIKKANSIYRSEILKMLRPSVIKKVKSHYQLNNAAMFRNYTIIAVRNIARNKLFSSINIIGLAISMSVCLLMISFLSEIFSYDKFHENADRMYRVTSTYQRQQEDPTTYASASILAGKRAQEEIPGIEAAAILANGFGGYTQGESKTVEISGLWASKDFFKVFPSFRLLQGNPETALQALNSVVLTEAAATKLFGSENAMGKVVKLGEQEQYTVTGIVETPPHNSHFTFESLADMGSFEDLSLRYPNDADDPDHEYWMDWDNIWTSFVYVLLNENTKPAQIDAELQKISDQENAKVERVKINASLQPLLSIVRDSELSNHNGKSMDNQTLLLLSGLTLIVILSAGFNYTNLSIARSLRRAKEVGVRKVVGASKRQIFWQFMVEAVVISLIALVFASLLFQVIKPEFLNLNSQIQEAVRLQTTPTLFSYFLVFTVIVGLMAGFFPALFLSKTRTIDVLNNSNTTRLFKKVNMRRALIVLQFSLSIGFIISTVIAYKQYKYALEFDLGFQTENVLNVRLQGVNPDNLANAFAAIPEVSEISKSAIIPSLGNRWGGTFKYGTPLDSGRFNYNYVDENYIPLMRHELIAGDNFEGESTSEPSIIVNEKILEEFNIGTPEEAVGKYAILGSGRGRKYRIRGVVKDFQFDRISEDIKSFCFIHRPGWRYSYLNLKINSTDLVKTMDKLDHAWNEIQDVREFSATFYDENIERAYAYYSVMFKIASFLAFLTISIATLGLLGMAIYSAETRLKEISIRKVLGASEAGLVKLLAKGFMWLILLSSVIAVPVAYYLMDSMVLSKSANRISIGTTELLSGVLLIFVVALLTIGSQTWKTARSNPAETLRNE